MICPVERARWLLNFCNEVECLRSSAHPSSPMGAIRAILSEAGSGARGEHGRRVTTFVAAAGLTLIGSVSSASASLIGAQVSYQYDNPTMQSVNYTLPTQTVTPLTTFNDTANGLMSYFLGNQLVVQNTEAAAFVGAAFNGPQFTFSGGGLTGAKADPVSATGFPGVVSSTANSVQVNYQGLDPALGASQIIDLASSLPLAGQQVSYQALFPSTGSVNGSLPATTLTTGTYFADNINSITTVIGANSIMIINDLTAGFVAAAFDGVTLTFSGANISGAAIDPLSAADFLAPVSFTSDSVSINFSNLVVQSGDVEVIDVHTAVPEPASATLIAVGLLALGVLRFEPRLWRGPAPHTAL